MLPECRTMFQHLLLLGNMYELGIQKGHLRSSSIFQTLASIFAKFTL
jgi:hypothetical protein